MSTSFVRFGKTETRDLAERARTELRLGEPPAWLTSNGTFFMVFVAIAALLAALGIVLSVAR